MRNTVPSAERRRGQVRTTESKKPPEFVVVEAKGSTRAVLGERRGLPPEQTPDQAVSSGDPSQRPGDGVQNENEAGQGQPWGAEGPAGDAPLL